MPMKWRFPALCLYALFCVAWAAGCGDKNSGVVFIHEGRDAGHIEGWMPEGHAERALRDLESCTECHGDALDGGISAVGCTACHLGGVNSVHPPDWTDITYHGPYAVSNGFSSCASVYCHGANLEGVPGSGPSCASCHFGAGVIHPPDWGAFAYARHDTFVESNGTESCAIAYCHGSNLQGVPGSGPSCASACHMGGVFSKHPLSWSGNAFSNHRNYAEQYGTAACANQACHGPLLMGVPESGPSCSSCHGYPP